MKRQKATPRYDSGKRLAYHGQVTQQRLLAAACMRRLTAGRYVILQPQSWQENPLW